MATTGSSASPSSSSMPHTLHPQSHPYLNPGAPMKPPLPAPPFRQPGTLQSIPQRSHPPHPHHLHPPFAPSHQQLSSAPRTQQYLPTIPSRIPSSSPQQQLPPSRGHGNSIPRLSPSPATPLLPPQNKADAVMDPADDDSGRRILRKRSIHELVFQIDPSERLDSEVEDILEDIANDFVESITTFGCTLAKHRNSTTLEAKDILLHVERNWNMVIPGFTADEIKTFRKPVVVDAHRERLAAVKKSVAAAAEALSGPKNTCVNPKNHAVKLPSNAICQDS